MKNLNIEQNKYSLKDCFLRDFYTRNSRYLSLKEIIRKYLFDLSYNVIVKYRVAIYLKNTNSKKFNKVYQVASQYIIAKLAKNNGVELKCKVPIGWGFVISHAHDIVIGDGAIVKENVTIYNGVTLGVKEDFNLNKGCSNKKNEYPTIESNVIIYTGAKIIGPVTLGKLSVVGANAVVLKSFPDNSVIAGIPAKQITKVK